VLGCSPSWEVPKNALVIDRVEVEGAEAVDGDDVEAHIATAETARILGGVLEGVPIFTALDAVTVEYRVFDQAVLDRDLERVRRYYRARGFYDALVRAGRVVRQRRGHVRVEIVVDEGLPVLLEDAQLVLPGWEHAMETFGAMVAVVNEYRTEPVEDAEELPRFDEGRLDEAKKKLVRAMTDNGYAYGEVKAKAEVDVGRRRAKVRFDADTGPPCTFGPVTFEGLDEIPEEPVRRAAAIVEGEPYSTETLDAAQYALADFDVFATIEITAQRSPAGEERRTAIPVVVHATPIKLRALKIGVGGELGSRIETHVVGGWEDRNFVGGLRRVSIDLRPGLVFFPTSVPEFEEPTNVLPEAQLILHFQQPAFLEARTTLHVSTAGRIYRPLTLSVPPDFDPDAQHIVGYREIDAAIGVDRKFRGLFEDFPFYLGQFVKLQFDDPFSYNLDTTPEGFESVLIPYVHTIASWDLRLGKNDEREPALPYRGFYMAIDTQGAALGDAEDIRLRPEIRAYAPIGKSVVFALRWATGFLFPFNYAESIDTDAPTARDLQLMSFRGFFSGGPSSNRGYGYRDVGPHSKGGFESQFGRDIDSFLPQGGVGMWELSAELRIPLGEQLLGVIFVDASDVVRALDAFRVDHPHISPGLGLRFLTPVGSLRFDVGVRPPYLQHLGERYLELDEGGPDVDEGESDDFPLAVHIAIGEAY
jgi:outer membrane protein insertion porin family/translocation and assembly module TamA